MKKQISKPKSAKKPIKTNLPAEKVKKEEAPADDAPKKVLGTGKKETIPQDVPKKALKTGKIQKVLLYGLGGLISAAIIVIIVVGVGVYSWNWNNKYVNKVIEIVPYPAAMVNYRPIKLYDFRKEVETLTFYYQQQKSANPDLVQIPDNKEIKRMVLERLIRNEFLIEQARKEKISVSKAEIDQELDKIIAEAGSSGEVEKTLRETYNWSLSEFKLKILKPFLLGSKLEEKIAVKENFDEKAKTKAADVLTQVKAAEKSFEELARQYSEDETASQGGDLGYFKKGDMVPEFEEAAFKGEVGKVYPELVKTQYGYHIIKVVDKMIKEGTKDEFVRASHILIKPESLETWLSAKLAEAKVIIFLSGFKWDKVGGLTAGS